MQKRTESNTPQGVTTSPKSHGVTLPAQTPNTGQTPELRKEHVTFHATLSPDLQAVVDSWDSLPGAVKAGIVAMVKAVRTK